MKDGCWFCSEWKILSARNLSQMMLLLYLPFYIIPFLLFHSSILRLRLVGPDMDRYRVSNVIIIVSGITDVMVAGITDVMVANVTDLCWPEPMLSPVSQRCYSAAQTPGKGILSEKAAISHNLCVVLLSKSKKITKHLTTHISLLSNKKKMLENRNMRESQNAKPN